ncbi:hypothetical protein CHUAL_009985 [Chamberlinius hualienensis]
MATVEKLLKSFEALKLPNLRGSATPDDVVKKKDHVLNKKEKIAHCNTIADAICSASLKTMQDFPKYLGVGVETFLACIDDADTDVRMTADECLNRIIKTLLESNISRIQVELFKEIKKNGSSRSLRAALLRFADLCHLIRPQKCRPYMVNLVLCLVQIARRTEESVQETLAASVPKICTVLGKFTTDGEIKMLLKAFLQNLKSSSAVIRRTSATCLTAVCLYSRKSHYFFTWCLRTLIETLVPVSPCTGETAVLGVLLCFRQMIPHLNAFNLQDHVVGSFGHRNKEQEYQITIDEFLQVYELILHYVQHDDHNIANSSLECLLQLLRTPPKLLLPVLLQPTGIRRTHIYASDRDLISLQRVGSEIGSIPSLAGDEMVTVDDDIESLYAGDQSLNVDGIPETVTSFIASQDETMDNMSFSSVVDDADDSSSIYSNIKIGQCLEDKLAIVGNTGTIGRNAFKKSLINKERRERRDENDAVFQLSCSPPTAVFKVGNIGDFLDSDVPLVYCARLLCSSFLLTGSKGSLMPEKHVRVSVKSLALSCLSGIISLYPKIFCLPLFKVGLPDSDISNDTQFVSDVLLFAQHSDPQMRGSTAQLIGCLIMSALCDSKGDLNSWSPLKEIGSVDSVDMDKLVNILLTLLADETAVTCRLTVVALKLCMNSLINSCHGLLCIRILEALLELPHTSYWLVKVELVELLSEISYVRVSYLEQLNLEKQIVKTLECEGKTIQDSVVKRVLLPLLGDEDFRVRHSTALSFVKIIPKLFYKHDHTLQDPIIALGLEKSVALLEPILYDSSSVSLNASGNGLTLPFNVYAPIYSSDTFDAALSRIVDLLTLTLSTSTSKYLSLGCLHSLSLLSDEYPVTVFNNAWRCGKLKATLINNSPSRASLSKQSSPVSLDNIELSCEGRGLLSLVISLLTSTSIGMDISGHQYSLKLASNLFAGCALICLEPQAAVGAEAGTELEPWAIFKDNKIAALAKDFFTHVMRLLSICTHAIEDQSVGLVTKPTLPSLPNPSNLSPIRRNPKTVQENISSMSSSGSKEKDGKGAFKSGSSTSAGIVSSAGPTPFGVSNFSTSVGSFIHLPHYVKLLDIIRGTYSNYKVSMDLNNTDKYTQLLNATLYSLSQFLEVVTVAEVGRHAEEILRYLRITVNTEPLITTLCVQQLLKSLFGTNLASQWEGIIQCETDSDESTCKPGRATRLSSATNLGLYHYCFSGPCNQFAQSLGTLNSKPFGSSAETRKDVGLINCIRKKWERKLPSVGKTIGRGDKSNLAAYIRLFESLVIRSLKLYTVTSSVPLQCQVLQLLSQLVRLRVNYCLLDSEQIFIGFIIKQFEYIEGGQIPHADQLIPNIFHFLVLLSYERYHSKSIIGIPKIIQLCDGLMASGQPVTTHMIPSLLPIVEDLFLVRGIVYKSDAGKELDTQREVMVSILLRFICHKEVLEIFILILQQSHKENEDRWKKLSRQVIDSLLPCLIELKVNVDDRVSLDVVHRLMEVLAPSVFRPVDTLLRALLAEPHDLSTLIGLKRWLSFVLVVLRTLIAQAKEEVVLGRLSELKLTIKIFKSTIAMHIMKREHSGTISDSVSKDDDLSPCEALSPEEILARFILQVVGLISSKIQSLVFDVSMAKEDVEFISQQLAHLLLYVTQMFQSGLYRRVANVCMTMIKTIFDEECGFYSTSDISSSFLDIAVIHPTLTLQWCNLLILLNFDSQKFWSPILRSPLSRRPSYATSTQSTLKSEPSYNCNLELLHKGGLILFCDYICENLSDAEHMTWVIVNCIGELVQLQSEPPVNDLICNVHRNPAASGLFIQAINTRCDNVIKPSTVRKILLSLEASHRSQSGALLTLLIERFLPTSHLAVARMCASMACRRVEMLLAEAAEESVNHFTLNDINQLLELMKTKGIAEKHSRLVMLLCKLKEHWFPNSTFEEHEVSSVDCQLLKIDKVHFLKLVRYQCFEHGVGQNEAVKLLGRIEFNDQLDVMGSKEFNVWLLGECLSYGADLFLEELKDCSELGDYSPLSPQPHTTGGLAVFIASQQTLLHHIAHILAIVSAPAQVYNPAGSPLCPKEAKYSHLLNELFSDSSFLTSLQQIVSSLRKYLQLFRLHSAFGDISYTNIIDIVRVSVLILESLHWSLLNGNSISPIHLHMSLDIFKMVLADSNLATIMSQKEQTSWTCSSIYSIYSIFFQVYQPSKKVLNLLSLLPWISTADCEIKHAALSCTNVAHMILHMESQQDKSVPKFIKEPLHTIVIGLARHPLVNSYARTSPTAWQLDWTPESLKTVTAIVVPPLPVELLHERDVLCQFIYRINLLGWIKRQQFEETWMALLGVLSAVPSGDTLSSEDDIEHIHTACLAIKSITSLLLQTLLNPQPGNTYNGRYIHLPSESGISYLKTKRGKRFSSMWSFVAKEKLNYKEQNDLYEKDDLVLNFASMMTGSKHKSNAYRASQVSLEFLKVAVGSGDPVNRRGQEAFDELKSSLLSSNLDIHSCLHFLLDLYSQWLTPSTTNAMHVSLVAEAVRSVVMLSDIFTEKSQFEWMLDTLLDLYHTHPAEDEILIQYLGLGICKAVAVLGLNSEILESARKVVETGLKSTYLPTRILTLHGVIYLLEMDFVDTIQPLFTNICEYLQQQMQNFLFYSNRNDDHTLTMWKVAFFMMENCKSNFGDGDLIKNFLKLGLDFLNSPLRTSNLVETCLVNGLQRLVLTGTISSKSAEPIVKLAVDRFCHPCPQLSLSFLNLLLSCIYSEQESVNPEHYLIISKPDDPDSLITAMEKVTILFNRMKRGYPCEAETIAVILPTLMIDHFPLSEIMNKVIGEFISNQQPHPHLVASIVFQVFEAAHQQGQFALIREWVLLSLSNFMQQSPLGMAVWSLTCLLISATTNVWLRSIFPFVQKRMGKLESCDTQLFCLAAIDFHHQLIDESEKKMFISTLSSAAKPESPYSELLSRLQL